MAKTRKNTDPTKPGGSTQKLGVTDSNKERVASPVKQSKPKTGAGSKKGSGQNIRYEPLSNGEFVKMYDEDTGKFLGMYPNVIEGAEVSAPNEQGFWTNYNNRIAQDNSGSMMGAMFGAPIDYAMSMSQALMTNYLTQGQHLDPASAFGMDRFSLMGMLVNAGLDPSNAFGAGLVGDANRVGSKLSGALSKKRFKSEIDWGKWNKEIPKNKKLLNEYKDIERTSKVEGSWMRNNDGSRFEGTPEQFVQQNSYNFKQAFPEGFRSAYRGHQSFDPTLSKGLKGNFYDDKFVLFGSKDRDVAELYATNSGHNLDHLYKDKGIRPDFFHPDRDLPRTYDPDGRNVKGGLFNYAVDKRPNPIIADGGGRHWNNVSNNEVYEWAKGQPRHPRSSEGNITTDELAGYMIDKGIPVGEVKNVIDGLDKTSDLLLSNSKLTRPKSLVYNNGMFDMTNPNIYKSLLPAAGGLEVLRQMSNEEPEEYKYGGDINNNNMAKKKINKYPFGGIPDFTGLQKLMKGFSKTDPSTWQQQITDMGYSIPKNDMAVANTIGVDPTKSQGIIDGMSGLGGIMDLMDLFKKPQAGQMNMDMFTVNPSRGYQYGGEVGQEEEEEIQPPTQIQAEKGEAIVLPDAHIASVKAKKKHSGMKDDEVTDILPPGSFVGSADKRMIMTKKELEDIEFGYGAIKYDEDGATGYPKLHTAADIMTKKKMTPAQYLNRIKGLYPETKRENDAFAEKANEENLSSRIPYIMTTQAMTEMKMPKNKKTDQAKYGYFIPPSMNQNVEEYKHGGEVPKYWLGSIIRGIGGIFAGKREKKSQEEQYRIAEEANKKLHTLNYLNRDQSQKYLGLSSLSGALGVLGQDPTVDAPQLSSRYLDQMNQEMPRYTRDYAASQIQQSNRPMVNYAMQNSGNFQRGMNSLMPMQANNVNALSNLSMQSAMQNMQMRDRYLSAKQGMANQQETMDTDAKNKTRSGRNTQIDNLFGRVGANYFNETGRIGSQYLANTGALYQQKAAAEQARERGLSNADTTTINNLSGEAGAMFDQQYNIMANFLGGGSMSGGTPTNFKTDFKYGDPLFQQQQQGVYTPNFGGLPNFNAPTNVDTSTNFSSSAGLNTNNYQNNWNQGKKWVAGIGWVPK